MAKLGIADKPTLDKVLHNTELIYDAVADNSLVYGFIERGDVLAPNQRIEYIGANKHYTPFALNTSAHTMALNSWADFEWLEGNRPAMVKQDGTLDYWLDVNDYTKDIEGNDSDVANVDYNGNAFAWIPKIYKYEKEIGTDRIVKFSMHYLEDFEPVGFIDEDGNELDGVWIPLFYGWRDSTGKMRSIANNDIATHSLNLRGEYNAIHANGDRYKFFGGSIVETLTDLMILFAKSTELQGAYGYGNRSGYDSADTVTYGKTANLAENCGQFYGSTDGKSINRVFHSMVLITQNQYQRDPYLIVDKGRWKVSPFYKHGFNENTFTDGYIDTGIDSPNAPTNAWTYPNHRKVIARFGSIPAPEPNKGSTVLGICDGVYRNAKQSSFVAVTPRFCDCATGSNGGLRALHLNNSASSAHWAIGASLLLLPPVLKGLGDTSPS